ncbi:MAG: hypothetical protein CMF67_03540 [Magnetovibrio sp.]|nr:hypothetical protein [Magnetovibrio sp.]
MALSLEFKRAIAAAAITRLSTGRRTVDVAAKWVSNHVGDSLYANRSVAAKTSILIDYRKKILAAANGKADQSRIAVARYHYDQCLEWIAKAGLKPEESARLLIETMRGRS